MSCYFRHMNEIFDRAGIEVTRENRKKVDEAIHKIMATTYKDCPATWKKIKQEILADPGKAEAFIKELKKAGARGYGLASCDACHTRHVFSVKEARQPQACQTCHMGFDHP